MASTATRRLDLRVVPAGEMLPLSENGDALECTCRAVRRCTSSEVEIYHSRRQLLVFDANEDDDTARRYLTSLLRELTSPHPATEITLPCTAAKLTQVIKRAFARANTVTNDGKTIAGPKPIHRKAPRAPRAPPPQLLPVQCSGCDDDDPFDVEMEIERELGAGGPPPPEFL